MKSRLNSGIGPGIFLGIILLLFSLILILNLRGQVRISSWLAIAGVTIIIAGGAFFFIHMIRPLNKLEKDLSDLSRGKIPDSPDQENSEKLSRLEQAFYRHTGRIKEMVNYSKKLADGEPDPGFSPAGEQDEMGNVLIVLRNSLSRQKAEAGERQKEDEQRNWASRGLADFNDLLREAGDDIPKLSYSFIKTLVNYVEAEAGGLYLVEEGKIIDGRKVLQLTGSWAFDREKHLNREVLFGEGLVGRAAVEADKIYLTELPGSYLKIRSGLGEDVPVSLLLVPVKQAEEVLGVIELAAFLPLPEYKINFVSTLGENIGSVISKVYANVHTGKLLLQAQRNSEELARREEEMGIRMEELKKIQEQSALREKALSDELNALKKKSGA